MEHLENYMVMDWVDNKCTNWNEYNEIWSEKEDSYKEEF